MNSDDYPWNVEINVGGVTFSGPGMETKPEAEAIKNVVEAEESVESAEVVNQRTAGVSL